MKREDCSLMIFPFGYDVMKGTMTLQEVCELAARKGFSKVDVLGINESLKDVCRDGYTGVYAVEYAHPGVFTMQAHEEQIDKFLNYLHL